MTTQANIDHMLQHDHFSKWLGIEVLEVGAGYCRIQMQVRKEMLNGFGILHGGVSFSLADSAFAFASNSHGQLSVSISNYINYINPAKTGDVLIAEAKELSKTNKTGNYDVEVKKADGTIIALFRGTVYRTSKNVIPS